MGASYIRVAGRPEVGAGAPIMMAAGTPDGQSGDRAARDPPMSEQLPETVRASAVISGRVQGVAFRYYTVDEATALGLSGWVRNLPDGRVELVAEGPRDRVDDLIRWCHRGPPAARVDAVEVTLEAPRGDPPGFHIRR